MEKEKYLTIGELDCFEEDDIKTVVSASDFLCDIKQLIKDYYTATFLLEEDGLKVMFKNGQVFKLIAIEF